ncbi:MAG: alpha/beta hydrolase [Lachnospiraceae bacterium]|nr:alpha/beta hydrolase [Lachnospiraceae bacterium]
MNSEIIVGIVLGVIFLSVAFYLFTIMYASYRVYVETLTRKSKEQWGRVVSSQDPEQLQMDAKGQEWQRKHNDYKKDVHIVNEGLNLYGEYYDFGHDKAVIILSGRTESLRYGYYFSKPYSDAGMNVLVVDPRAHGFSDGKYNTVGFEESKDALAWAKFLHQTYQVKDIVYHGICIGAAAGMYAITSKECPNYIRGIVTEGMFANFGESMKNHLIERKKLWFPIMQCIDFWMKKYTGHSMTKGPIDVIGGMDKPILMIQSKCDLYSTAENAKKMFEMCPSREKQLVLYEKGGHSLLRYTDTEKYDRSIMEFLKRILPTCEKKVG